MSDSTAHLSLRQQRDYQFVNRFDAVAAELLSDEPAPLGRGAGPSPLQLLGAAVGNCLSASLLFALRKFKQSAEPIGCEVQVDTARNAEKRLRVGAIGVRLTLGVDAGQIEHLDRILGSFEEFCTVTASIRQAIAVQVQVFDARGAQLK